MGLPCHLCWRALTNVAALALRGATHTTVKAHRRAASASPETPPPRQGLAIPETEGACWTCLAERPTPAYGAEAKEARPEWARGPPWRANVGGRSPDVSGALQRHAAATAYSQAGAEAAGSHDAGAQCQPGQTCLPLGATGRSPAPRRCTAPPRPCCASSCRRPGSPGAAGQLWGLQRLRSPGGERRTPVTQLRRERIGTVRATCVITVRLVAVWRACSLSPQTACPWDHVTMSHTIVKNSLPQKNLYISLLLRHKTDPKWQYCRQGHKNPTFSGLHLVHSWFPSKEINFIIASGFHRIKVNIGQWFST